jgi:hypothetical protein
VIDAFDLCADTPAGEEVDDDGCSASQLDDDADGVSNARDVCPDTPLGEVVDDVGCGPSQKDEDGDGVSDADDLCPGTPQGEEVDEDGCSPSQYDADDDGVPDGRDDCPGTAAGVAVDEGGCPFGPQKMPPMPRGSSSDDGSDGSGLCGAASAPGLALMLAGLALMHPACSIRRRRGLR